MSFARTPRYAYFETATARIETIFEPLGIDTSDWSTDFRTRGRFAFYERFGTPGNTEHMLQRAWHEAIPEAERLSHLKCRQLQPLVTQSLHSFFKSGVADRIFASARNAPHRKAPEPRMILARCTRCHGESGNSKIPRIPFDDPAALQEALLRRGKLFDEIAYRTSDIATRDEQMPPRSGLHETEREALLGYLRDLMQGARGLRR
jgi:hypothetical protein